MARYICRNCNNTFIGTDDGKCPVCGSMAVRVKESSNEDDVIDIFEDSTGDAVTDELAVKDRDKEPYIRKTASEETDTDVNEKIKSGKTKMIAFIAAGIAVIAGVIVLAITLSGSDKGKSTKTSATNNVANSAATTETTYEAENYTFMVSVESEITGNKKQWDVEDGLKVVARTGSVLNIKRLTNEGKMYSDGFSLRSSNTGSLKVDGDRIEVLSSDETNEAKVMISSEGKPDISIILDIKPGGWNKIDDKWYFIDETDSVVTGWLRINEDGSDKAYYLDESGSLVMDTRLEFGRDDSRYACKIDRLGRLYDSWLCLDGNVYRYGEDMNMIKSQTVKIGDGKYRFDENGVAYSDDADQKGIKLTKSPKDGNNLSDENIKENSTDNKPADNKSTNSNSTDNKTETKKPDDKKPGNSDSNDIGPGDSVDNTTGPGGNGNEVLHPNDDADVPYVDPPGLSE